MKNNSLTNLWKLIHSLKKEEIEICKKFLRSFDSRGTSSEKKSEKLFCLLLDEKEKPNSSDEFVKLIYGDDNKSSFIKLIFRLRNKILESLILDINLERKATFSERSKVFASLKKKIVYAQILRTRARTDLAIQYLDSVIIEGTEYEFWDDVIMALKAKREIVALYKGRTEYNKTHRLLLIAKKASFAVSKAQHYAHKIGLISNYGIWVRKNAIELRDAIIELRELKAKTNSILCEYYLRLVEAAFYQGVEDFAKAEFSLKKIVELTEREKVVRHKLKRATALLNLAENHILQGNFITGLMKANDAIKDIEPSHNIAIRGLELQFYSIFYNGEYVKAFTLLNKALKQIETEGWEFIKGRLLYLKACTSFCIGNYESVDADLIQINPIELDKEGYNLWLRLLLILNAIERSKYDLASDYIESFRKQVSYLKKGQQNLQRAKNIYTVLNVLSGNAFDFKKTLSKVRNQISELETGENSTWKILSPELIVFEQWFMAKAEGRKIVQKIIFPVSSSSNLQVAV